MDSKNYLQDSYFTPQSTVEELQDFFEGWSETYDTDLDPETNWPAVLTVVKTFLEVNKGNNKDVRILDLGAGTGYLALELRKRGLTNIDALDGSQHMLSKAKEKNLYKNYLCEFVVAGKQLTSISSETYDGLVSSGTITGGYVKSDVFDEVLRWVKKGGYICFSIRKDVYDEDDVFGYATKFQQLANTGKWQEISKEVHDYCYVGLDVDKECYICCYKVLKH